MADRDADALANNESFDSIDATTPTRLMSSANWSLLLLTLAYVLAYVDRNVLSLLIVPIQEDLGTSDVQMSLLVGASFSIFYAIAGLPLAWLADRRDRKTIIAVCVAIWSAMTAASGLATAYFQLMLARIGVAVGEASIGPAGTSVISDYFDRDRRVRALSIFAAGAAFGGSAAFIAGGFLLHAAAGWKVSIPGVGLLKPWQLVLILVGTPGLLVSALMALTMREPRRRGLLTENAKESQRNAYAFLRKEWRVFLPFFASLCILIGAAYGSASWFPTYLARVFGWRLADAGIAIGLCAIIAGPLGAYSAGLVVNHLTATGRRDATAITAVALCAGAAVPLVLGPLSSDPFLSLSVIALAIVCISAAASLPLIAVQELAPNEFRAQVVAVYALSSNLFGFALGPTLVAAFTDYLFADPMRLGWSMSLSSVLLLPIAGALGWLARVPYAELVERDTDRTGA